MRFTDIFIKRPVLAISLSFLIALLGFQAIFKMQVREYPEVINTVITVNTSYYGASADLIQGFITQPLEQAVAQADNIDFMTSSSQLGSSTVTAYMKLNTDPNAALSDILAKVNSVRSQLPKEAEDPSVTSSTGSTTAVLYMGFTSPELNSSQITDYLERVIKPQLFTVGGVSKVDLYGGVEFALRVWLDPAKMAAFDLTSSDVMTVLNSNNYQSATGQATGYFTLFNGNAETQVGNIEELKRLVVATRDSKVIRLSDIAKVSLEKSHDIYRASANGREAVVLAINAAPTANPINIAHDVLELLPSLKRNMPSTMQVNILYDSTIAINESIHEVIKTILEAAAIVLVVITLFLGSFRAVIIPIITIPLSLIGVVMMMDMFGFSINLMTLLAMVLAIGLVVDDAIVVLENISRHLEAGVKPLQAALQGTREVGFTVLSMSLSLVAVFLPLLLMGGLPGRLLREFAVTLSVAIGISLAISLTLTPMMCGWMLKRSKPHSQPRRKGFGRFLMAMQEGYGKSLKWVLNHTRLVGLVLIGTIVLNVWMYITIPKTFFPEQDTGVLMGGIQADQSISFQAMRGKLQDFMKIIREDKAVDNVTGFTGGSRVNSGMMFITLKPRGERNETAQQVIDRLRVKLAKEPGANLFLMAVQDIRVGGRQANASYQYTLLSDDLAALREWEPKIRKVLAALPQLADVNSDQQDNGAEMALTYDRETMSRLGINVEAANSLLNNAFGQREISTIYQPMNQYKVVMEVDPRYTQDISALDKMFVINNDGKAIPLSYFASWQPANAPLSVNHQGLSAASTISFNLPAGSSLSEASDAINRAMTQLGVPSTVRGSFAGTAQVFQETMNSQVILILAAIATVYIVLGVLYESYVHPLTILSTLPSAGVGALLALELFGAPFSLIALIGIMLLIGIVKKNAIMMVDFALDAQRNGNLSPEEAIFQACLLRFRPIMMTTLAALFGALPLVISGGDGSELRQPLGITIVGGLVMSQLLTLYTTPVVYLFFDRLRLRFSRKNRTTVTE